MFKKCVLLILIFLPLSSTIASAFIGAQFDSSLIKTVEASLNEIVVHEWESIQVAINGATENDTIRVMPGTYREHINVTKTVKLVGEDPASTIIDGENQNKTIITVLASDVEIRGFTIQNAGMGIQFAMDPFGIKVWFNVSTTIRNNNIMNSYYGIWLSQSNRCHIFDNTITNCKTGIQLSSSSSLNRIVGNTIRNNSIGVITSPESRNTTLYRNNFINNNEQIRPFGSNITLDNGAEGNFWSDYTGEDSDGDGIGDTPYPDPLSKWDEYPLKDPWSLLRVHRVPWDEQTYNVTTYCNSTVASFNFSQSGKQVSFNATGPPGALGFCNVTIPKTLLNASSNGWTVYRDTVNMTDEIVVGGNGTHTSIYFAFSLGKYKVRIVGTDVIPEFPTLLYLVIFMIATLIATILVKRRDRIDIFGALVSKFKGTL